MKHQPRYLVAKGGVTSSNIATAGLGVRERMVVSPDQAWSVAGPNKPPSPPAKGTVPDPLSDFIKAGHWAPADEAQAKMVEEFKKKYNMKYDLPTELKT